MKYLFGYLFETKENEEFWEFTIQTNSTILSDMFWFNNKKKI